MIFLPLILLPELYLLTVGEPWYIVLAVLVAFSAAYVQWCGICRRWAKRGL